MMATNSNQDAPVVYPALPTGDELDNVAASAAALEARIAMLEEQMQDLAGIVGGVVEEIYGRRALPLPDCDADAWLEWHTTISDEGTPDEAEVSYWVFPRKTATE